MAGRSLKFEQYVESKELFTNDLKRFEFFLASDEVNEADNKTTKQKTPLLLSRVGAETYAKIRSQLIPWTPHFKMYNHIWAAAKVIYKQQLAVIGPRNMFMLRKRKDQE